MTEYPSKSMGLLYRISNGTIDSTIASSNQAAVPLHVIVVGAGLGGLATSVALARKGHHVTVLEQAKELREVITFFFSTKSLWQLGRGLLIWNMISIGWCWHPDSTQLGPPSSQLGHRSFF